MTYLANGKYLATATSVQLGFAGTNTPQVAVAFDVEGPDGGILPMTWYGFFTDAAEPMTMKALRNLGFDGETDLLTDIVDGASKSLVGARAKVTVQQEEYQGQSRSKIRFVDPEEGGPLNKAPMAGDQLKAFAAQVRQRAQARRAESGRAPSPVGPRPAARAGSSLSPPAKAAPLSQAQRNDDIPF